MQRHHDSPLPPHLVRHRPRPLIQRGLGHTVGVPPPQPIIGDGPHPRAKIRNHGSGARNGPGLSLPPPPAPGPERWREATGEQQRSDGVDHHALLHPGALELGQGALGSGGGFPPVAEDSGDVEEEVDAFVGEFLDGGDRVGEGVFGFDVELDDAYAGGGGVGGEELCESWGCFGGSAAGYDGSLVGEDVV